MGRGLSVLCSQAGCVHSVNAHAIRHIRACLYIRDKVLMPICGRVIPALSSLWINSRRSGLRLQLTLGPLSALSSLWINSRRSGLRLQLTLDPLSALSSLWINSRRSGLRLQLTLDPHSLALVLGVRKNCGICFVISGLWKKLYYQNLRESFPRHQHLY